MDKRSFLLDLLNASNLLQRQRPEEDQLILVFVETKKGNLAIIAKYSKIYENIKIRFF